MKHHELDLVAVIMAGGMGTRFWPLSTEERPKQFLQLFDERSLLQKSFDRVSELIPHDHIMVLTNEVFMGLVRDQLPEIPPENIIGEPFRRDTAGAVCLGAVLCRKRFGDPIIATLTADHIIEPTDLFQKTLLSAAHSAKSTEALFTFGIRPTYPATGYGYLELGPKVADYGGIEHFELIRFKEKPNAETARQYIESGGFLWNSGMFVWTADAILHEIETHLPGHNRALKKAARFDRTPQWPTALRRAFASLQTISIDYAVMEKAAKVLCVASSFSWKDVGGWPALKSYLPQDEDGNAFRGHVLTLDAQGNLIFCEDPDETIMLVGVDDLIAVRAGQKTLIVHKDKAEEIKGLVPKIQKS